MSVAVRVITGSRLHFGPLAAGVTEGRRFGGIGLMTQEPRLQLTVRPAETDVIQGPSDCQRRVADALARLRESRDERLPEVAWGVEVSLERLAPQHQGFGAGTQLALAVAQGVVGLKRMPAVELASRVGRGERSAIGVHGFELGGWIVDAGKRAAAELGTLAARLTFPEEWPIVLWSTPSVRGLAGGRERAAIESLPAMSPRLTDRLSGIVLRELLPSIEERDWEGFALGLRAYGDCVGEYFAPVQGGLYSDPQGSEVVEWFDRRGLKGVAQSSWGPTLATVLPNAESAADVVREWPFDRERLLVTSARNRGADVDALQ